MPSQGNGTRSRKDDGSPTRQAQSPERQLTVSRDRSLPRSHSSPMPTEPTCNSGQCMDQGAQSGTYTRGSVPATTMSMDGEGLVRSSIDTRGERPPSSTHEKESHCDEGMGGEVKSTQKEEIPALGSPQQGSENQEQCNTKLTKSRSKTGRSEDRSRPESRIARRNPVPTKSRSSERGQTVCLDAMVTAQPPTGHNEHPVKRHGNKRGRSPGPRKKEAEVDRSHKPTRITRGRRRNSGSPERNPDRPDSTTRQIQLYQSELKDDINDDDVRLYVRRLTRLDVGVQHLAATGIGRTLNLWSKREGRAGDEARNLLQHWRGIINIGLLESPDPTPLQHNIVHRLGPPTVFQRLGPREPPSTTRNPNKKGTVCRCCKSDNHRERNCPHCTCKRCGKRGHWAIDCPRQKKQKRCVCFNCGKLGTHFARDCTEPRVPKDPQAAAGRAIPPAGSPSTQTQMTRPAISPEASVTEKEDKGPLSDVQISSTTPNTATNPEDQSTLASLPPEMTTSLWSKEMETETPETETYSSDSDSDSSTSSSNTSSTDSDQRSGKTSRPSVNIHETRMAAKTNNKDSGDSQTKKGEELKPPECNDQPAAALSMTDSKRRGEPTKAVSELTPLVIPPRTADRKRVSHIQDTPNDVQEPSGVPPLPPRRRPSPCVPQKRKTEVKTCGETDGHRVASHELFTRKRVKTRVFSGVSQQHVTAVPELLHLCLGVIKKNLTNLFNVSRAQYSVMEEVVKSATTSELRKFEKHNPYLVVSKRTEPAWELHCGHDFRGSIPRGRETWRELHSRLTEDRNCRLSILAKRKPSRTSPEHGVMFARLEPPTSRTGNPTRRAIIDKGAASLKTRTGHDRNRVSETIKITAAGKSLQPKKGKTPLMKKTMLSAKRLFRI